jgi:hypothetical protein
VLKPVSEDTVIVPEFVTIFPSPVLTIPRAAPLPDVAVMTPMLLIVSLLDKLKIPVLKPVSEDTMIVPVFVI